MRKLIILVTGASSGIGYQAAKLLAKAGNKVYGGARHIGTMQSLHKYGVIDIHLDVTNKHSCQLCMRQILKQSGRIDVLINCAGYGSFGPVEEVPIQEVKKQLDVNLLGIARLCQLAIPSMRQHHFGKIINISSIAGRVPTMFGDWYNVSKFAVEALSDDMRTELSDFGIKVILIEPGLIKTPWGQIAAKHLKETTKNTTYDKAARMVNQLRYQYRNNGHATKPIKVARKIVRTAEKKHVKARYLIGKYSHLAIITHALLPTSWFDKILKML